MLYAEDSFFTLSMGGRVALGVLSVTLAIACLWFVYWIVEGTGRLVRALIAIAVLYLFVWVSPQIYYLLYLVIIDDLPLQWVVQAPPNWRKMLALITFTERATLTEHSQGLLFWGLILTALLRRRPKGE